MSRAPAPSAPLTPLALAPAMADALARWYGAQIHVGRHPAHAVPQVFLAS